MIHITPQILRAIMPHAGQRAEIYSAPVECCLRQFHIDRFRRVCSFIAQIAHESGELRWVRELASGQAYEGRRDLGNTQPGDGPRFRGRGLIQVTGRVNYRRCSQRLFGDPQVLLDRPEILELPEYAVRSAGWFWDEHRLNDFADRDDFVALTRRINGGTNGLSERLRYYRRAQEVLRDLDT